MKEIIEMYLELEPNILKEKELHFEDTHCIEEETGAVTL